MNEREIEKRFMTLPIDVIELLDVNELVFVKGGNAPTEPVENSGTGCHCGTKNTGTGCYC